MSFSGFCVPADHSVKIKGSEKIDKYLDLTTALKKLWNMRVTGIPVVVSALGIAPKSLKIYCRDRRSEEESRQPRPQYC